MIDYEWKIQMLETELAHYKHMQEMMKARLDTHDSSFAGIENVFARIAAVQAATDEKLDRTAALQQETAETVKVIAEKLKGLIDALRHGSNGHT